MDRKRHARGIVDERRRLRRVGKINAEVELEAGGGINVHPVRRGGEVNESDLIVGRVRALIGDRRERRQVETQRHLTAHRAAELQTLVSARWN